MKTIGLDIATSTGVCWTDGNRILLDTWLLRGTQGAKINQLVRSLRELIATEGCSLIAIEDSSFGSKFAGVQAFHNALRGAVEAVCADQDIELWKYHPTTIKKETTDYGKATKEQVQSALKRFYGIETTNLDESDAAAICMLAHRGVKPPSMVKRAAKKRAKAAAKKELRLF